MDFALVNFFRTSFAEISSLHFWREVQKFKIDVGIIFCTRWDSRKNIMRRKITNFQVNNIETSL